MNVSTLAPASGAWISRRRAQRALASGLESLVAVVLAVAVGAIVLALTGHNPVEAYVELVRRALFRPAGLQETLVRATPLLIAGVAVLVAARAGLWNIGIDGQVLTGALAGAIAGTWLDSAPRVILWTSVVLAALLAGAAWTAVPALLRSKWQINEIVTTIMFNYVAISLTAWLVRGPFRDEALVTPQTPLLPRELRFPHLGDTRVHVGVFLAVALWLIAAWWLHRTVAGFELRATGLSPRAARHALIPVGVVTGFALVASGAVAAIAGANDVLATKGTFQAEWNPEYGLSAFALVFLARRHVLALLPAALFLGMLHYGADVMPRAAGIPAMFFPFLEGVMLIALAVFRWQPWQGVRRARRER